MNKNHPWAIAHSMLPGIVIEDPAVNGSGYTPDPTDADVHHHGDPVTVFPGKSCDQCVVDFAIDFIAKTAAQRGSFMIPAPADYLAVDRTINEERERLRWEFLAMHVNTLYDKAIELGVPSDVRALGRTDRDALIEAIVDRVCPRAWLDRRLKEVL